MRMADVVMIAFHSHSGTSFMVSYCVHYQKGGKDPRSLYTLLYNSGVARI